MKTASSSILILCIALAMPATAAITDDELWILTAGRGPGAAESLWITDLWIMAPGDDPIEVELTFLDRTADNSEAEPVVLPIEAGEIVMLHDVVFTLFGRENAFGAIHIEIAEDEDEETEDGEDEVDDYLEPDAELLASAHIYDMREVGTVGLMLAGVPSSAAIRADANAVTLVAGVSNDANFRTNWFGVNVGDEDDGDESASVRVDVLDGFGEVMGSRTYAIPPRGSLQAPVSEIAPAVEAGALRFTMLSGTAAFGASRVDNRTNDPSALESAMNELFFQDEIAFTDEFAVENCTWSATGGSPFFPLQPGLRLELEGEDDGETVEVIVEVLNETFLVGGVTTRVVTETESVDGELEEISRNYFAECLERGSVFYFGEHVALYEDGELVGSEGEWLAGENGARAGMIMPGAVVAGSRYYQEIAPEVALDRAEHIATGVAIETPAGMFEECLVVEDSTPLEPGARDRKVYCPGFGIVWDDGVELVGFENAPAF